MSESKIKKAVIREDLLSITKDYRKAILLNQFIYWSERVSDADKFIEKENEIAKNNGEVERELFYGWIYKTAEELADEVMLGLSASQIRRYINDLVDLGYLSKRNNPKYKWDRTLQYKVNLVNIAKDLKKKGFPLSDYKINIPDDENTITHGCVINGEPEENQSQSDERAIPENTSKNTDRDYISETTKEDKTLSNDNGEAKTHSFKKQGLKKEANELFERIWKLYPKKIGKGQVSDTQKLKLLKIGYEELERAVRRCCQYNRDRDMRYWQNGSTFFNSGYVDFLDENYDRNDNNNNLIMKPENYDKQNKKDKNQSEQDFKIKLEEAKKKAIHELELEEGYWEGVTDGEAKVYLEMFGIYL